MGAIMTKDEQNDQQKDSEQKWGFWSAIFKLFGGIWKWFRALLWPQCDHLAANSDHLVNYTKLTPDEIYQHTITDVNNQIGWYTKNACKKKRWAQRLRITALVLLGIGFILPVFLDISNWNIPGSMASVVLALGTGLIAFDRYMGHSSGWMRFIKTELLLNSYLSRFQYETYMERLKWEDGSPDGEQQISFVKHCADFRNKVWEITNSETKDWMEEFRNSLRALDQKYEELVPEFRSGAIELTVKNGDQFEEGWQFYVDNQLVNSYNNTSAAASDVSPGIRKVRVVAKDEAQTSEERIIKVEPGQISRVEIELKPRRAQKPDAD